MRAAVVERYGPPSVVSVRTWPDPQPGRGEVLVRVGAASVNSGDARIRGARFPRGFGLPARVALGIRGPRQPVLGVAFAGTVSAVGESVSGLRIGDRVAGMNGARMGAHAELLAVRADRAVPIPEGVSDADAAGALFGGTTAMHFLRDLVGPGTSVLVNGSSGSVGSAAVQLARAAGGTVTAVTRDENAPLARRLGASATVDYTRTQVAELTERYDVVLDTVGNIDIATGTGMLTDRGTLLLAVAGLGETLRARGRVRAGSAAERPDDIAHLLALVAAGSFDPLAEVVGGLDAVAAAHGRVDSGRKTGNLVVEPAG